MKELNVNSLFGLKGKTALITGASKGIGKEIALLLANFGADIALVARDEDELGKVAKEIQALGRKASYISLDLTNTAEIPAMVKAFHDEFGSIDVLVNNAGINIPKPASEITEADWDKVMDINMKSVFFTAKETGKYMMKQKSGKVINVSSQMAFVGYFKRSAYASSKGGITQLTKALAIEWAEYNINVNAIAPTFIETPMTAKMFEDKEFKEEVLGRIPLGRLAKTEDLYGAFVYLASGASDMVTGHTLLVDGGWTTW